MPENNDMDSSSEKKSDTIDIQRYRALVKQFIEIRRYKTALFWAEKVCVITNYKTEDIYTLAHCFFLLKEYHRTAHTIRLHGLEKTHIPSYNLLLESLYEGKEYEEALSVINAYDIECWPSSTLNQNTEVPDNDASMVGVSGVPKHEVLASIMLIKGKIFEATDNRGLAMDYYVQALHKSVYCYEALDALVKHEMLMAWEEKELLRHLPMVQQSSAPDAKLLSTLYQSKLKKYHESLLSMSEKEKCPISKNVKAIKEIKEQVNKNVSDGYLHKDSFSQAFNKSNLSSPSFNSFKKVLSEFRNSPFSLQMSLSRVHSIINESQRSTTDSPRASKQQKQADGKSVLSLDVCLKRILQSTDIMASEAEKLFYKCYYNQAMKVLEQLLKIDPFHEAALTLQIGCYVEFGDFNKLFYTAHKLVDRYPDKAISWYAVGCYYDLIGKSDPARRFLSKATTLDRLFGPAWLAYGHSFAKENEHDQAMAAYFKATQLMRGCHLPLLYIGVECGLTKNLNLAEKFFYQAMSVAALDVFVMHELGVIKYEYQYYESAEEVFRATADVVKYRAKLNKEEVAPRWEPLFNNLGHCLRKNKKYKEAIEYHQMALLLKPQSAQTYTALGFAHALMEDYEEAITYFHKSLAINRDCIVTSTILKNCIEDQMTQTDIICDIMDKSLSLNKSPKSAAKTAPKRLPSTNESPPSHGSMKFNRTEEDDSMTQTEMEMSMETQ